MELKLLTSLDKFFCFIQLLIVPYGIETMPPYQHEQAQYLLIVPYGIETRQADF